jgi:glycosidase/outer membrane protein assembly factor BamB
MQATNFRGDPQRTGVYAQEGDFGEWMFNAEAPITSSPVVVDGALYFASMGGDVYALDPASGELKWKVNLVNAIFSTPAVVDGVVYIGTLGGTFYALDVADGKELWKTQAGPALVSSPAVAGDLVLIGSLDGNIYALDRATGKQVWKYATGNEVISSPVVQDGVVIVGSTDNFVYALEAATGVKRWLYMAEGPVLASPTILGNVVYVGSNSIENSVHAIDLASGDGQWKAQFYSILATFAAGKDAIYGGSMGGGFGAVSSTGGEPLWARETGVFIASSPALLDDRLIYGDEHGQVHAVDRANGDELWTYPTQGEIYSSPAVAGQTVFIGSTDGYLYALNINEPGLAPRPVAASIPIQPTPTMFPPETEPPASGSNDLPWWNDRVFYEVFVRSFKDSNGDGTGDLQGLIEKLDYLNDGDPSTTTDLGVTGLWLMPITQSPSYHGYDTTDYFAIEQDYGTNDDFKKLIEEAHQRGMVVIIDMVLNHTSNQHPWFSEAATPGSKTENWYIWSDEKGDYLSPWGSEVWHRPPSGNLMELKTGHLMTDYYYGMFWSGMPDLNYRNGAVTEQMNEVLKFWLDEMGADGFRLDAVRHLIEDGEVQANTPETHSWLQSFDNYVHSIEPQALTVGEIWDETAAVVPYVPEEVDIAFEFKLAEAMIEAINKSDNTRLVTQTQTVLDSYPYGQMAPFLTNHDMTRVMNQLGSDPQKAKLAAALMLSMPGVPFIYYGEEIGLTGAKPDDLDLRRPMQWDNTAAKGFTSGTPWAEPGTPGEGTTVAAQSDDPSSLLSRYRSMIQLRNENPALRAGDTYVVETSDPRLFALLRYVDGQAVLALFNLSGEAVSGYQLSLAEGPLAAGMQAELLLGAGDAAAPRVNAQGGFTGYAPLPELAPYEAVMVGLR